MSTRNVADLLIPSNYTAEDCVHHMMVHGASMYPDLLSADTADELRRYVLKRNSELSDKDAISVIENEQRWSFGIGANDDPIVAKALREIATNSLLVSALDGIAGDDPAVIEMTAITSAYGAKAQFWHIDTVAEMGNDLKHARSFVPSYSLFIPLQDTTAKMGATETCPGTQVCHEGGADEFCSEYGFQVSGTNGVWKRGYGVLQNQHTYHRGPAHTDPHGKHRVLFILTFAPRPNDRAESRMIGQGGSYSIRWDMWGHTLSDLADASWKMAQPWAALKAMGIFKLPGTNWGWDYPAVVSMRIQNEDVGFTEDELDEFIENGGFGWLPSFLTEEASDAEEWVEYLVGCVDGIKSFLVKANKVAVLSYFGVATVLSILQFLFTSRSKSGASKLFVWGAVKRLVVTYAIISIAAHLTVRHIAATPWARDVSYGRQFASPLADAAAFHEKDDSIRQPTLPQKVDALFAIRYDGENYGSVNRFLDYHPGNQRFKYLVNHFSGKEQSFSKAPLAVRDRAIDTILGEMKREGRRILVQNTAGGWLEASAAESHDVTSRELLRAENVVLSVLDTKLALMIAKARYGELRSTVMAQKFTVDLLESLRQRLFATESVHRTGYKSAINARDEHSRKTQFRVGTTATAEFPSMQPKTSVRRALEPPTSLHRASALSCICNAQICITKEHEAQFLPSVGDIVEAKYEGQYNEWYKAKVTRINPLTYGYDIEYYDGDTDTGLQPFAIRRYIPPQVGEVLEARVADARDEWALSAITKVHNGGNYYDVRFEDGRAAHSLPVAELRRVDWDYEKGDEVIVISNKTGSKGSKGVVVSSELRGDAYDIRYEDGSIEVGVARALIHLTWALEDL